MKRLLEIRPGPLSNKGGELMLRAIVAELGREYRLAAEPWIGPYESRAALGLYQKLWISRFGRAAALPARVLPRPVRALLGVVTENEIVGVIDAAGFGYGDALGPERTERAARAMERWHRSGKRTILLPQAFGPFTGRRIQPAATSLFKAADLIFARDTTSLEAVQSLGLDLGDRLLLAPDFTNLLPGTDSPEGERADAKSGHGRYAYIVPNVRMLRHLPPAVADAYVPFLVGCSRAISDRGVECRVLVHEGRDDTVLAERVRLAIGQRAMLVTEVDPQRLKGLIARSCLVVGSRFHALVSALSEGVPVIAAGWSHKYAELLNDYDCRDALVSLPASDADVQAAVAHALDEPARSISVGRLKTAGERERQRTREMWRRVRALLETGQSGAGA